MKIIPKKPFTWLLIVVAVYAYVTYPKDNYAPVTNLIPKNEQVSVTPDKKEPGITDKPLNAIVQNLSKTDTGKAFVRALAEDAYKKKYGDKDVSTVTAQETSKLQTLDSFKGDGAAVVCGSTVEVNYESFTENNLILDSTAGKKPLTFKVGSKQVIKGLENGVVGMKKGGKRRIAIPSRLAYDDPEFKGAIAEDSPVLFEVELLDVKDGLESVETLAIENVASGEGVSEALCGNDINLTYKVLENDKEVASGPLSFRIGNGNVPIGLEKGVMEMKIGAVRKLIIPQSLLKIKNDNILPDNIKLPESGNLTIEITLVELK